MPLTHDVHLTDTVYLYAVNKCLQLTDADYLYAVNKCLQLTDADYLSRQQKGLKGMYFNGMVDQCMYRRVQFTECVTITRFLGGITYLDVGDAVNEI